MYPLSRYPQKAVIITGIIFSSIAGSLLHFLYDWSDQNKAAALISSVNESTWEHLKLLFFPILLFTIGEVLIKNQTGEGFLFARTIALLIAMFFITAAFYTYTGIWGKNFAVIDIALFIIGAVLVFILTGPIEKMRRNKPAHSQIAVGILIILTLLFFIFTFFTPYIGLFLDPVTNSYGPTP